MRACDRRHARAMVWLLVACLTTLGVGAAEPPFDLPAAIARLDGATRVERAAGERALIDAGPELLPALDDLDTATLSPAAAAAVNRVRDRLERQRAINAAAASRLTANLPAGSLGETLDAIAAQTGNRFTLTAEQAATVLSGPPSVSPTALSFWEATEAILSPRALATDGVTSDGSLTLGPADPATVVTTDGPFQLAAGPAVRRPIVGDADRVMIRVPLTLTAEPRLRPLFLAYAANNLTLTLPPPLRDSTVKPLTFPPYSPHAKYDLPLSGRTADLSLDFVSPTSFSSTDTDSSTDTAPLWLSGTLAVTLAAGSERFVFPGQGESVEQRRGGVTVRRSAIRWEAESVRVETAVVFDRGGPAFESHRAWVFHNAAYLLGPQGERISPSTGFATLTQSDGGVSIAYRFDAPADPAGWRFVYEAPTLILTVPVEVNTAVRSAAL